MRRRHAALLGATAASLVMRVPAGSAPYAPWAHSHFVWLSSEESNQQNVTAYVAAYAAHNITVGGVDVDSQWSTGDNNFVVDTSKFPSMGGFIADMHTRGIGVIFWMTSMVDTDSSNFAQAQQNGYLIKNGFNQTAIVNWWHGDGGFLDYGNPAAKTWWEGQLDNVLSLGWGGWKCDGTDPYILEVITPYSAAGLIDLPTYQDWYYGHSFNYTRQVNGEHCLIWSRPVDGIPLPLNLSIFLEYSPKYVMFSGWVGDDDPNFEGMQAALVSILESAWRNYTNFASDTGGYRVGNRTAEVLLRWAQLNAFLPLFENGGEGEHRPWMYDAPGSTYYVDIYRRLVAAHYELGPYLLATGTDAYAAGVSSITPLAAPPKAFPALIQPDDISDFSYLLGHNVLVSPIPQANVTWWEVSFPGTPADAWVSFWPPHVAYAGNSTQAVYCPLNTSATFARTSAILPLHVSTHHAMVPNGDASWASALTALIIAPAADGQRRTASVPGWQAERDTTLAYTFEPTTGTLQFDASPFDRDVIVLVRGVRVFANTTVHMSGLRGGTPTHAGLQRVAHPGAISQTVHAAAVAWEAAGVQPRWPLPHVMGPVRAAAASQEWTWSAVDAETSPSGMPELLVRAGSGNAGVKVLMHGVYLA